MISDRNKTCIREAISQMMSNLHSLRTEALYGNDVVKQNNLLGITRHDLDKITYLLSDDKNAKVEISAICE